MAVLPEGNYEYFAVIHPSIEGLLKEVNALLKDDCILEGVMFQSNTSAKFIQMMRRTLKEPVKKETKKK